MSDRIEKVVILKAPVSRVWQALTDHEQFGTWFRVALDGPFQEGAVTTGRITFPGYEHYPWRAIVERMEPERYFSFRWHDYDENAGVDVADQATTLVEFVLEETAEGTRLTITESGFDALADPRRLEVLRNNTEGWAIQAGFITEYLANAG